MAALWVAVSAHCQLEFLPGFELLRCDFSPGTATGSHCEVNGCGVVKSGQVQTARVQPVAPAPVLLLGLLPPPTDEPPQCLWPGGDSSELVPPELPRIWQFSLRTALSPRAPSLAS